MREKSKNKLIEIETDKEQDARFPETAPEKLASRYHALVRRRAKNKMRRATRQKQR